MRKLEIKDKEIMRLAVQQEILRSEVSRYDHRLHGILLVCLGWEASQPSRRTKMWSSTGSPTMPAFVPANGFSQAQAAAAHCQIRSRRTTDI